MTEETQSNRAGTGGQGEDTGSRRPGRAGTGTAGVRVRALGAEGRGESVSAGSRR